jgi:co-chaperonin GroES (HSP10)
MHASVASFRNWHTVCVLNTAVFVSLCGALQCAESEKTTSGGVLLANDSGDKPNLGTVVSVGEGRKDEEGKTTAPNVAVGATVMYSKYSGTEFEVRWLGAGV